MNPKSESASQKIAIRYDKTEVLYAREFLVSTGKEELMLDFSSGLISEVQDEHARSLPIHTRLALPWSAVQRLANLLNQALEKRQKLVEQGRPHSAVSTPSAMPLASLPRMSDER